MRNRMFRSQRGAFEYLLEDFKPYRHIELFLTGSCDVEYRIDDDDPDVGYVGGIEIEIVRISLCGTGGEPDWNLDQTHDLYKAIERRLLETDDVKQAIIREIETVDCEY